MTGEGAINYPVLIDVNMNTSRAKQVLTLLKDGGYFDTHTEKVSG